MNNYMIFRLILCCGLLFAQQSVQASCKIDNDASPSTSTFNMPSFTVNANAAPGTIIATQEVTGDLINVVDCTDNGDIYTGYTVFTSSDARTDNPLSRVYQTNVPGIGFRVAWAKDSSSALTEGSLVTPMHIGSAKTTHLSEYSIQSRARAEFVVTGVVQSGVIDVNMLNADWIYDSQVIAQIRFAPIAINVTANTCNLVEKISQCRLRES